jgi:hypothetical protein
VKTSRDHRAAWHGAMYGTPSAPCPGDMSAGDVVDRDDTGTCAPHFSQPAREHRECDCSPGGARIDSADVAALKGRYGICP